MDGSQVNEMEARLPDKVPHFQIITENEYRMYSPTSLAARSPFFEEVFPCECRYREDANDHEAQACGERSSCINRTLSIECNRDDCPCRDNCQNQRYPPSSLHHQLILVNRFQKYQYADVEVIEAAGKGFGLRTRKDLEAGQFIMEYVGEVLSQDQLEDRARKYTEQGQKHYYFMTLQNDQIIDATQRGNLSRFMNHSCNPNCATQKWIVNGRLRIGLFTLRRVKAMTELTFDYKFIRFGADAQKCLCGESNCKGVIGEEQKEAIPRATRRATAQEEEDAQVALEKFTGETGAEDENDMALLARTVLRTEDIESVRPLLQTIERTDDVNLLRRFLALHGLQILNILLGLHWRDVNLVKLAVAILEKLPITHRNVVEDAHIEEKVLRIANRDDLSKDIIATCKELVANWKNLEMVYRIPKATAQESNLLQVSSLGSPVDSQSSEVKPAVVGYTLSSGVDKYKKFKWTASSGTATGSATSSSTGSEQRPSGGEETRQGRSSNSQLPPGWRTANAPDGRLYYFHEITRETRWDPPHPERVSPPDRERRSRDNRRDRYDNNNSDDGDRRERSRDRERREESRKDRDSTRSSNQNDGDEERRLKEIIERAKRAAMNRADNKREITKSPVEVKDRKRSLEHSEETLRPKSKSEDRWSRYEGQLRDSTSQVVVKYLSRWCRSQIPSSGEFKDLARKLTHGIVHKEIKALRKEHSAPPDLAELSSTKRAKVRTYLIQYLRDHGYRVDEEDGEITEQGAT